MNVHVYQHVMVTGAEYKAPVTPFLCAGDRARLEMDLDLLKSSLSMDDDIVDVSYSGLTHVHACPRSLYGLWVT